MRTKAGPRKVTRPETSQQRPAQAKLTKRGRAKGSQQDPAQAAVMKRGPGRPKRSQQEPEQTPVIKRRPGRKPKHSQQDAAQTPLIKEGRATRSQQDPAQTPVIRRRPGSPKRYQQDPEQTPVTKRRPGRRPKHSQQDAAQTPVVRNLRRKRSQQDPAQTSVVRNLRPKRGQQDPAQAVDIIKEPGTPKRSQENPPQAKVIKRKRPDVALRNALRRAANQSKRGPKRKRAQDSVAHSSQPSKQVAKGRKGRAVQLQGAVWPTMHDSLDIDFEHWNPDEIAQQWNARARAALGDGGQDARQDPHDPAFSDLTTEDMGQRAPGLRASKDVEEPQEMLTENVARAAFKKRKSVAIPEDELARLGLSTGAEAQAAGTSSAEAPEAAKLFWAGEELMDVGGGRFYPSRLVREEGDMPVAEWMQKEAQGLLPPGDYEVTAIVDERKRGTSKEYIVKWKGFELNAEQWLPRSMLVTTKAMRAWAQKRAVDGQWHASSHAEWARLSARAAKLPAEKKPEDESGPFQQVLW